MGGSLKDFFDRAFYPTQGQVTDKPYVAFLTHGGGGKAIGSIESIAQSFKLKKAADSVLVKGKPEGQAVAALKSLGSRLAASAGKP
jgi:flavorubredoxin